jgi:hypothetical protein
VPLILQAGTLRPLGEGSAQAPNEW